MDNINRYKEIKKVGQGTYGAVYKSTDTQTGKVSERISSLDCCC